MAVYLMESAQQDVFDIAMAFGEACYDACQFNPKLGLTKAEHSVGKALRPRRLRAAGQQRLVRRNERPDDNARRIGAQLDR